MILAKVPIFGDLVDLLANIMGIIMNFLFIITNGYNVGLCIILFTIIVRLLMLPMTIKQQKFSKLSAMMQPEIKAVQDKYKGKTDNASMMKMQEETKAVYAKYGTSPTGGCLQLFIQLPIFYGIFAVVRNIPKYVGDIRVLFEDIITKVSSVDGYANTLINSGINNSFTEKFDFSNTEEFMSVLNTFSGEQWQTLQGLFGQVNIADSVEKINHMNNFFGINLATAPGFTLSIALVIPILAGITQWLSVKLMNNNNPNANDDQDNSAAQSMKMMNTMMPIISAIFCVSMPAGLGLYWIMGSVVQCVQQVFINRYMDSVDIEKLIEKNLEKANAKRAKQGLAPQKVDVRAVADYKESIQKKEDEISRRGERAKEIKESTEYYNQNAKPGSLAAKANMVKLYNEKNSKN